MQLRSIRFRLAAWYFASFAVMLAIFSWGAWLAMRASLFEAVDHDLRTRTADVRDFLNEELNLGPAELQDEFREQALLGLAGGRFQITGERGLLFRSERFPSGALKTPNPGKNKIEFSMRGSGRQAERVASQDVRVQGRSFRIEVAEPLHEFVESLDQFEGMLFIGGPLLLLLASLGGLLLSSQALAPVDRITADARQINIQNLSGRLQVPRAQDELQRLAQTLNEMLDRIDTAVRRIVQFTADASHELRAPLALIHTAAEFSLRRERTREELLDAMQKILRESERTSLLVDNLLVLARADSGMDELQFMPTDLAALAHYASEQVLTLAEPKHIHVETEIPPDPVVVQGDEQALGRLFLILLDNAVKYTNEGGRITVRLDTCDSHAEVEVSDTGIGIAGSDLPHIYDRFWRADRVRSRSMGGAGLGLSIARWIVERHQGVIQASSELGHGSKFTLRLPLEHSTNEAL